MAEKMLRVGLTVTYGKIHYVRERVKQSEYFDTNV